MKNRRLATRKIADNRSQSPRNEIINRLAELPTTPDTKDLLHDIFFEFILAETKDDVPGQPRIRAIKNIRFEIMELYALAEKARALVNAGRNVRGVEH